MLLCWEKHVFVATRSKPVCGCIGPGFNQRAKRNHYCALVHVGKDHEKYRERMLALGRYHCRDIHQWEGGSFSFQLLTKCSCKGCTIDAEGVFEELKCPGKPYHSVHVLKCDCHALAYQIECTQRAKEAETVIDPGLEKGRSNLSESTFSVLAKFRAKDVNLRQKHYQASTNLGLIQRRKRHFSHDASLPTILSNLLRSRDPSFQNGCDGGTSVASAYVSEIKAVISVLRQSRVCFQLTVPTKAYLF